MSDRLGFNNRQTLGAIETGERNIQATELVAAAEILGVGVDYFTDPYTSAGEASFSFRTEAPDSSAVAEFERTAGNWLATFRELSAREGRPPSFVVPSLALAPWSSYEQARSAAEDVREALSLGPVPALGLASALETRFGVLVLYVDTPDIISGAASRLENVRAILVNRNQPAGRRNYSLAHELFHVLTWDSMPKGRDRPQRIEVLANNFAAALLMPRSSVVEMWESRGETPLPEWMSATAARLRISPSALRWRLNNLGLTTAAQLPTDAEIAATGVQIEDRAARPLLFAAAFVRKVFAAVETGVLSLRRASGLLGLDALGFAELCRDYDLPLSYEI